MIRTLTIVTTLALLALPAVAFAEGPPCDGKGPRAGRGGGPGGGHGHRGGPNAERLAERAEAAGVDSATIDKIKAVGETSKKDIEALRGEKEEAQKKLHELMGADTAKSAKVMEQIELLGHIRTELQKKRMGVILEIRKLVTVDQWKKMRPERGMRGQKGKRGKRGKGMRGRGMGNAR